MTKGIFEPMFDTVDDAIDMVEGHEEASDHGDGRLEALSRVAAKEARRETQQRRQEMLLVERFLDEWDETKAVLRSRLKQGTLLPRMSAAMSEAREAVSNKAIGVIATVAHRVYEKRIDREESVARLGGRTGTRTRTQHVPDDAKSTAVSRVFGGFLGQLERLGVVTGTAMTDEPIVRGRGRAYWMNTN